MFEKVTKEKIKKFLMNIENETQTNTNGMFILIVWQILINDDAEQIMKNSGEPRPHIIALWRGFTKLCT